MEARLAKKTARNRAKATALEDATNARVKIAAGGKEKETEKDSKEKAAVGGKEGTMFQAVSSILPMSWIGLGYPLPPVQWVTRSDFQRHRSSRLVSVKGCDYYHGST